MRQNKKMYGIYFKQGKDQILFPVAPASITIKTGNSNQVVELVSLGQVNLMKKIGLREISFTVLLPYRKRGYMLTEKGVLPPPYEYLEKIRQMKESCLPVTLLICRQLADGSRLFDENIDMCIEEYRVTEQAGEQGDFWLEIHLKEYRKIQSTVYQLSENDGSVTLKEEAQNSSSRQTEKTYTVKSGDSLWLIAKTQLGDGSLYRKLAEQNGITNPNLIYPGQVLVLKG